MPSYRCYFLNLHSQIAAVEFIEAEDDAEATQRAAALFAEKGTAFSGFEVWDRARRIERDFHRSPEQIRAWRMRAEEIRTSVESYSENSARHAMLHAARTYDTLADNAEARLQDRKRRDTETG